MLRHACRFKLANDRQDTRALQHYLGYPNIQRTVRYAEPAAGRLTAFGRIEKWANSPGRVQKPHQIGGLRLEYLVAFR
jgi:hypothetical protein